MATVAMDKRSRGLFVFTSSPSKASSLGLSPISTARQTETPRELKGHLCESGSRIDNNDEEDEGGPLGQKRSDSWGSRTRFSPRPKRQNNEARRPVQSVSSIRGLCVEEESEAQVQDEVSECPEKDAKKTDSFRQSNQSHLERIQEADSADETDNESQGEEDEADEYDGDGEDADEDTTVQLYKSYSGDLVLRYDGLKRGVRRSHEAYDEEDDDVVRI